MDGCLFCKIVKKEIPATVVWEDAEHLAFLDIHPIKPGHTLVIPKQHHSYVFELEDAEFNRLWLAAKKISSLLKKAFNPKSGKIGVIVYGLDVDHTHIHLVPIDRTGDLSFANAKNASAQDLKATLERIKSAPAD